MAPTPGATKNHPLRLARRAAGMTQAQLAERAGVSYFTVSRTENGQTPRRATLFALAYALNTVPAALTPSQG
jgi:transcriptional regulator with XRE-family HTH domain